MKVKYFFNRSSREQSFETLQHFISLRVMMDARECRLFFLFADVAALCAGPPSPFFRKTDGP